jgi:hypothetical protein
MFYFYFGPKKDWQLKKLAIYPGGAQKCYLLHKAGGRVVYFGYKHQRKVERGGRKRQKN